MPLLRGLEVLGRQEKNPRFSCVLGTVAASIKSGATLSEALRPYPRIFDRLYLNMIKAGEAGGVLDTVLDRLARLQEKGPSPGRRSPPRIIYIRFIVLLVAVTILLSAAPASRA